MESRLSLLPKSPSQSLRLGSRDGSLGVCTHSLGGMKPSLVVRVAVDGLEKTGVGIVLGGSWRAGWSRNAVASSVDIVGVAAGGAGAGAADAHGAAGVAVAGVACLPARIQVQAAARSEGQFREPARSPSARSVASNTHGSASPIAGNTVAGRACTAHLGPRPARVFGGTSARRSHLLRMVGSSSPGGESDVGVW